MGSGSWNRSHKQSKSNTNVDVSDGNKASNVDDVEKNPNPSVTYGSNEHLKKTKSAIALNGSDHHHHLPVFPSDGVLPSAWENGDEHRRSSSLTDLKDEKFGILQHHKPSGSEESENSFVDQTITFPVPDFIPQSNHEHVASMMQSPPMQVMERSRGGDGGGGGYDPSRIPSAIFETNKTTPVEWSSTSNESLFSLQLGTSFSRGSRLLSMEYKPGEVEFQFSPSPPVSVTDSEPRMSVMDTDNQPSVPTEETREETTKTKKTKKAAVIADKTTSKEATKPDDVEDTNDRNEKALERLDEIEENNLPCCYCTWPQCHCTWPSCYCSCLNCSSKRLHWLSCCSPSPTFAAGLKTTADRIAKSKSQLPPPVHEATPAATKAITKSASGCRFNWFSWFSWSCCSCRPSCCRSWRPSCCCSWNPFSYCSNFHRCSCSSCHQPCRLSSSCCCPCPCLCSSCCPCKVAKPVL